MDAYEKGEFTLFIGSSYFFLCLASATHIWVTVHGLNITVQQSLDTHQVSVHGFTSQSNRPWFHITGSPWFHITDWQYMASHHCAIVLGYTSLNDSPWIHINEWQSMASHHCTTVLGYTSLSDSPQLHITEWQSTASYHHCATVLVATYHWPWFHTSLCNSPWLHITERQSLDTHHEVTAYGFTSLSDSPWLHITEQLSTKLAFPYCQ